MHFVSLLLSTYHEIKKELEFAGITQISILQFDGFWSVGAALQFFFMTFACFNNADIAFAGESLVANEFSIHLEIGREW